MSGDQMRAHGVAASAPPPAPFRILTIGWNPWFVRKMLVPIQNSTVAVFDHGIVGDPNRIERLKMPDGMRAFALSPRAREVLPEPDLAFLASLETVGVPSVRNMILGDRVLNQLSPETAVAYASFLGKRIEAVIRETRPDLVLGSFDSLHSGMGLAVARKMGVPWTSLVYTAIPAGQTAFSTQMNPNALLPIARKKDEKLYREAQTIIDGFRQRDPQIYRNVALSDVRFTIRRLGMHVGNMISRFFTTPEEGRDPYTWPTMQRRLQDVLRRAWNSATLPTRLFIHEPPGGDFAYYPLHMQPESSVDNWAPFYQDQLALAQLVLRALPANCTLVVKLHFIDPDNYSRAQLKNLLKLPGVKIADPLSPSRRYLEAAKLVIGIQGTACLEAALMGKPTLIFGDSPYQYFPNTERAKDVNSLQQQIGDLIARPKPSDAQIKECVADYISRFQNGSCNDWSVSPSPAESENLVRLFVKLVSYYRSDAPVAVEASARHD